MSFFGSPVIRFILDDSALYLSDKCETDTVDLRRGATHDENHAGGADIITHILSLTVFFLLEKEQIFSRQLFSLKSIQSSLLVR